MADVTFIRGYGFPRGGSMDYAGLGRAPGAGAFGTYTRDPRVGADGCPIDTVRVGDRCVPFSQLNGLGGLGDCGGGCGCAKCGPAPMRGLGRFASRMRQSHDASLFSTIPSLDGLGDGDFEDDTITPGPMLGPDAPTDEQWAAMNAGKGGGAGTLLGLGLLALGAAWFFR